MHTNQPETTKMNENITGRQFMTEKRSANEMDILRVQFTFNFI